MTVTPQQLNQFLNQHFNLGELRTLCFELGIPYEDLEGGNARRPKILALVEYAQRHGLFDAVVTHAQAQRPHAAIGNTTPTAPPSGQPQQPSTSVTHIYQGDVYHQQGEIMSDNRKFKVKGPVFGNLGDGDWDNSGQNTGRDNRGDNIHNEGAPKSRDEFVAQLQQLQTLLQEAIAAQEVSPRDGQTLTEDLQDVMKEVQNEAPRPSRITRRLQDITEIVTATGKAAEATGKTVAAISKASLILAALVKTVSSFF